MKKIVFCVMIFLGEMLFSHSGFAQFCPYTWPDISIVWDYMPDDYYTSGTGTGLTSIGAVVSTCTAYCFGNPTCEPVSVSGDKCGVYIDGQLTNDCGGTDGFTVNRPAALPEGTHNVVVSFTAKGYSTGEEHSYSFSKGFYADNTEPTIIFQKPHQNGVLISSSNLVVIADVSDSASKIRSIYTGFKIVEGACEFVKEVFKPYESGKYIYWQYCGSEMYPESESCDINIGIPASYALTRDLSPYLQIPENWDCKIILSEFSAFDRVSNYSAIPSVAITTPIQNANLTVLTEILNVA